LSRKSQADTKLVESFYHVPYLSIGKTQNVRVKLNICCNFANELLCLSELLYRGNIGLFAFLTVIWLHLQN